MIIRLSNLATPIFWVCLGICLFAGNIQAQIKTQSDIENLRKLFKTATGDEFELVKDEVKGNDSSHTGGRYWLAHVKPKRSGSYILKYTYKYDKTPRYSSEEGEHKLTLNVGGKICYRYSNIGSGISSYCLGDTIILPIRLDYASGHRFNLESRPQKPESLEESQKRQKSFIRFSESEQIDNPLNANLKLLGTQSYSSPYRACCAERITHSAYFEAVSAGRFNLSLSSLRADEDPEALAKPDKGGIPIIIVNPGTSITALLPREDTIEYADNKRFSAYAGNGFMTNVLILQPGDVFAVQYSEYTTRWDIKTDISQKSKMPDISPIIYKLPFAINRKWSFNEWIADYLPKEKQLER